MNKATQRLMEAKALDLADEVDTLTKRIAELESALKPFAEIGFLFRYYTEDQFSVPLQFPDYDTCPNINAPFPNKKISGIDFRRAAATLKGEGNA